MYLGELFLYLTWPVLILIAYISVQLALHSFERNTKINDE